MKIVAVIPARYKSSRFPGKPLADICGKPMIWWVYQQCLKVSDFNDVYVATESEEIDTVCKKLDMKCVMTSDAHPTGTDRVAEVAQKIPADIYFIVMGDEPMLTAADEILLVDKIKNSPAADAFMLVEKFNDPVDVVNTTTIKLALNDDGDLIFMSRAPIPYPKSVLGFNYYKNVGCYAMKKETLDFFLANKPSNIERAEEIELLRLIEKHKIIKTAIIDSHPMSVDTPKDLERARHAIQSSLQKIGGGGDNRSHLPDSCGNVYVAEIFEREAA